MTHALIDLGNPASDHPLNAALSAWWMFLPGVGAGSVVPNLTGRSPMNLSGTYSATNEGVRPAVALTASTSNTGGYNVYLHTSLHSVELITRTVSGGGMYVSDFGTAGAGDSNRAVLFYSGTAFNIYNKGYPAGAAGNTEIPYAGNNVWQQILYATDGTTLRGYRNGVRIFSVSANLNLTGGNYRHDLGQYYNGGSQQYVGAVLSERVYARFLSDGDASGLYEDWLKGFPLTLRRFSRRAYLFGSGVGGGGGGNRRRRLLLGAA